ncbi:MAG: hypothetical protein LIP09_15265 [Bacteroidales bacterium]|nr:hypothetical protein [Bacteroidales bacterium]
MKNIIIIFSLISIFSVFSGCSRQSLVKEREFLKGIYEINKGLPIELGPQMILTSFEFNPIEREIVQVLTIPYETFESIKKTEGFNLQAESMILSGNVSENEYIIQNLVDLKIGLKTIYTNSYNNDQFIEESSWEMIKSKRDFYQSMSPQLKAREYLSLQAKMSNLQCPIVVDDYTTQVGVYLINNLKLYQFLINENLLDMSILQDFIEEIKKENISQLLTYTQGQEEARILVEADITLVFQYRGSISNVLVEYQVTPKEFSELLAQIN